MAGHSHAGRGACNRPREQCREQLQPDAELRILRRAPGTIRAWLDRRLTEFNRRRVGRSDAGTFAALAIDPATGGERGGIYAERYWGWMHIDELWVDARQRRRGLGRRLMLTAEAEAVRRRCFGLWLDTWSRQAQGF